MNKNSKPYPSADDLDAGKPAHIAKEVSVSFLEGLEIDLQKLFAR
jgi:hypothetical protein